jgi:hypothetical protein
MQQQVVSAIVGFIFSVATVLTGAYLKKTFYNGQYRNKTRGRAFDPIIDWGLTLMFMFLLIAMFYSIF